MHVNINILLFDIVSEGGRGRHGPEALELVYAGLVSKKLRGNPEEEVQDYPAPMHADRKGLCRKGGHRSKLGGASGGRLWYINRTAARTLGRTDARTKISKNTPFGTPFWSQSPLQDGFWGG
mgnify:CR=1 FL=1